MMSDRPQTPSLKSPFSRYGDSQGSRNLLISVRRVSLFGPIPASRTPRVAGRLAAVLRDQLERATCCATDNILKITVVRRFVENGRGGSRVKGVTSGGPSPATTCIMHVANIPKSDLIDPIICSVQLLRSLDHNHISTTPSRPPRRENAPR